MWLTNSTFARAQNFLNYLRILFTFSYYVLFLVFLFLFLCTLSFDFATLTFWLSAAFVNWCKYCFGTRNVKSSGSTRTDSLLESVASANSPTSLIAQFV